HHHGLAGNLGPVPGHEGFPRVPEIAHEDADRLSHLGGSQALAVRPAHGVDHVVDQLLQLGRVLFHLVGPLPQDGVAVGPDGQDHAGLTCLALPCPSAPPGDTGRASTAAGSPGPGPPAAASTDPAAVPFREDRKSTRLNSSHVKTSYAVFCLKKKTNPGTSRSNRRSNPYRNR